MKGVKHKVGSVTIVGNKYFDTDLLKERMQVQKADLYLRNGRYSPAVDEGGRGLDSGACTARTDSTRLRSRPSAKDIDTSKSGRS